MKLKKSEVNYLVGKILNYYDNEDISGRGRFNNNRLKLEFEIGLTNSNPNSYIHKINELLLPVIDKKEFYHIIEIEPKKDTLMGDVVKFAKVEDLNCKYPHFKISLEYNLK